MKCFEFGFALKIIGFARTKWTEHSNINGKSKSNSQNQMTTYSGREDYLASTTYLLGSKDSENVEIQPGIHNFTFACVLPAQCPSSFEGKYGHIRYLVKVVLIRPWKFDQTYSRGFTVLKLMNLNYDSPVLRVPAVQETFKTYFCGPCTSQPIKLKVFLPQTGFVPGQDIIATVTVTNESTLKVIDLKISFVMLVTLFSQQPKMNSHLERFNLAKIKGGSVNSKTSRTLSHLIRVPATPPTCFNSCRLIKISYELEVEAKLQKIHHNPLITIPITIGNVPMVDVVNYQPLPSLNNFQINPSSRTEDIDIFEEQVSTISSGNSQPVIDFDDLQISPPSYEEAVYMTRADCNEDDNNALGKSEFLPRYPVYSCSELCSISETEPFSNNEPHKSTWL
ncbi:arrestin domain-containing protein 17-like isoform X2 [Eupeodes corollae]|uniref:arrestin domain-containing protein 17-like isoform X2 n=1 Tax=Eupeodes corollae TaxID=290404 RepID=UPI00249170DC|nr:arrestin domain-containing protein 17-like isoform X2 [Eupeodes corollae]